VLILNNPHAKHDITYKWKPQKDFEENGSIIYERGSLVPFKGKINTEKAVIDKVFAEGIERRNTSFVIETVSQLPFRKNDIIIDDMGISYLIINPTNKLDENQGRFLKSAYMSKYQLLGVEGDG
jgi:hypothetical protein